MPESGIPVSCSICGQGTGSSGSGSPRAGTVQVTDVPADPPVSWVYEFDARRGGVWLCDVCARLHLRSIEAGLDRDYW